MEEITTELKAFSENRQKYEVSIYNSNIETVVTHKSNRVHSWIVRTEAILLMKYRRSIVGLDIEWRPNICHKHKRRCQCRNPVAIIQLCVGRRCLIFQLLYADEIPYSLKNFLRDKDNTFVGVGIDDDAEKLWHDYELEVVNNVDLRQLAYKRNGRKECRNAGLVWLADKVIGFEYEKPRKVTMSKWDKAWLSDAQVQYACVDAFLSYKIGRALRAASS